MENDICQVRLVWYWPEHVRRNEIGFAQIKQLVASKSNTTAYEFNLFLYAFLCPAKNLDLFISVKLTEEDSRKFDIIQKNLNAIEIFERAGLVIEKQLTNQWLEIRNVAARATARDEQRSLATLLFSGPSTAEQVATDLGISVNLVQRVMQSVQSVLKTAKPEDGCYQLETGTDTLSATLYLLRCTLGIDPIAVLEPIIEFSEKEPIPGEADNGN